MTRRSRLALSIGLASTALVIGGGGVVLIWLWPALAIMVDGDRVGRNFYVAAASMRPTLEVGDRIAPRVIEPSALRRGQIITFYVAGEVRIARIAALAGDRITMRGGRVVLNGQVIGQRTMGPGPTVAGAPTSRRLERLPGEASPHIVLDAGPAFLDDMAEVVVPPDALFVLGDNRNYAADSRVSPDEGGAGLVQTTDVIGLVDWVLWSAGGKRIAHRPGATA